MLNLKQQFLDSKVSFRIFSVLAWITAFALPYLWWEGMGFLFFQKHEIERWEIYAHRAWLCLMPILLVVGLSFRRTREGTIGLISLYTVVFFLLTGMNVPSTASFFQEFWNGHTAFTAPQKNFSQ